MKFFVLFLSVCLLAFAAADETAVNAKRDAAGEKCKKEHDVEGSNVIEFLKTKKIPSTEHERCFMECVYTELGLIKDGKLNSEGAAALAKARYGDDKASLDKASEVFKTCNDEIANAKSNEVCANGKLLRSCFITHGESIQIFPKTS